MTTTREPETIVREIVDIRSAIRAMIERGGSKFRDCEEARLFRRLFDLHRELEMAL